MDGRGAPARAGRARAAVVLVATLLSTGACGSEVPSAPVSIGAFNFGESVILAEVYAQALQGGGVATSPTSQLTGREGTFPALEAGSIDFLPEYNGNALDFLTDEEVIETDPETITDALRELLEPRGLVALDSSPAENRDELVVRAETAQRYGLSTVSDLAPVADELTVGGPVEFAVRNTGLAGLRAVYGIEFGAFEQTDAGGSVTAMALEDGTIDVARLFSTDPLVQDNDWVVLVEDRPFSLPNAITPIVRAEVLTDRVAAILNAVSASLSTEDLVEFNRRLTVEQVAPRVIARDFLADRGLDDL